MSKNKKNNSQVTWAQAFRDIVIHSVNKGVLFPVGLFLFIIIPVLKLSSEDSSRFLSDIVNVLVGGYLLGWILFIATVILWAMFAKKNRQSYSKYMEIAGNEKTRIQQQSNPDIKLGTSNRR